MSRFIDGGVLIGGQPSRIPTLVALSLASTSTTIGGSIAILGALDAATLSATGLPAGVTLDGPGRQLIFANAGSVGGISLVQTLAGATNTPLVTPLPTVTVSTNAFPSFPALSAAYAAGHGLVTMIGDSTLFGLGSGSGGFYGSSNGAAVFAPPHLIPGLLTGVTGIDGCGNYGARAAHSSASAVPAYYSGSGVTVGMGASVFSGSWQHVSGWGKFAGTNASNDTFTFDPG